MPAASTAAAGRVVQPAGSPSERQAAQLLVGQSGGLPPTEPPALRRRELHAAAAAARRLGLLRPVSCGQTTSAWRSWRAWRREKEFLSCWIAHAPAVKGCSIAWAATTNKMRPWMRNSLASPAGDWACCAQPAAQSRNWQPTKHYGSP